MKTETVKFRSILNPREGITYLAVPDIVAYLKQLYDETDDLKTKGFITGLIVDLSTTSGKYIE
jgi:C-terminal processing protease CtpA/Prc